MSENVAIDYGPWTLQQLVPLISSGASGAQLKLEGGRRSCPSHTSGTDSRERGAWVSAQREWMSITTCTAYTYNFTVHVPMECHCRFSLHSKVCNHADENERRPRYFPERIRNEHGRRYRGAGACRYFSAKEKKVIKIFMFLLKPS